MRKNNDTNDEEKINAAVQADMCAEDMDEDNIITISCDDDGDNGNAEIAAHKKRADEMTAAAQMIKAEFDNYRKRTQEQGRLSKEDGKAEVIEKILPVLDSFSQAVKIIKDKSVLEGIGLIYGQLNGTLEGFGLSKMEVLGQEFNPEFMNAVMTRSEKGKSGLVVEVVLDGYLLKGRPLRAAMVVVGE